MFNAWKVIDKFLAYSITKGNFSSFQVENEDIDNVIERLAKNKENFSLHDLTVAEKTIYALEKIKEVTSYEWLFVNLKSYISNEACIYCKNRTIETQSANNECKKEILVYIASCYECFYSLEEIVKDCEPYFYKVLQQLHVILDRNNTEPIVRHMLLKKVKIRGKISQKEAAALCGVSLRLVQHWDKGERLPKGYPGRGDAIVFATWANEYQGLKRLKATALAMNRATPMNPQDLDSVRHQSALDDD